MFKGLQSIIEAQIVQEDLDDIRVRLIPAAGYDATMENRLLQNLRAKLGETVMIRIEKVTHIERGPRGKFPAVVSRVKHLYPDRM